jgi:hypothetical protein
MKRKILRVIKRFVRSFIPDIKKNNRVWRRELHKKNGITRAYYD